MQLPPDKFVRPTNRGLQIFFLAGRSVKFEIKQHDTARATIEMKNRRRILLVVDGRQSASRGVNLTDLAEILLNLGVDSALNLDGGGSSSFVVNGQLINKPVGGTSEREIVSAISVICRNVP